MSGILSAPPYVPYGKVFNIIAAQTVSKVSFGIGKLNPAKRRQRAAYQDILEKNRYQSFAPERDGNAVKWFADAHDYMWAIAHAIESAKNEIYILDWWLSPELYLKRPPELFPEWRLDKLLKRKAEQGVKIYVIVYNEVRTPISGGTKLNVSHID
ncbi:hypothetical protein FRC17_002712 [Serendipita sp. 399]|nr:hypothetical protein FRC17_002712 [Serendipita sp. 399]